MRQRPSIEDLLGNVVRLPLRKFDSALPIESPRWITWRTTKSGKKQPYDHMTGRGRADVYRYEGVDFLPRHKLPSNLNHGWVLGRDGDRFYIGFDFDTCRDKEGKLTPWAREALDALRSYAEVSPSGTGFKVWALVDEPTHRKIRDLLRDGDQYRGRRKWDTGPGKHPPGIMLCLDGYFAVTGNGLDDSPVRTIDLKTVQRVIAIGERIQHKAASESRTGGKTGWNDGSGNGLSWRLAIEARRAGGDIEDFALALEDCPEGLRSVEESSRGYDRQLQRDWDGACEKVDREESSVLDKFDVVGPSSKGEPLPEGKRGKPTIAIKSAELLTNLKDLDRALTDRAKQLNVYRRAGRVVHIQSAKAPAIFEAKDAGDVWARTVTLTQPSQMVQIAMRAATFKVSEDGAEKPRRSGCPTPLANHYLNMVAESHLPILRALINRPTIRPDGSVLQAKGFDKDTGLLHEPGKTTFPAVPDKPTRREALAALAALKRPVREFEFASDVDRAVWLSAVLTALVRDSLPKAPFVAFDAPTMGSGKTILASGVSMIARGFTAAPASQTEGEEERKAITSALSKSSPFLFIDNIEAPIKSAHLSRLSTLPEWEDRLLGTNVMAKFPTNIVVMFTGNNLEIAGDIIERTLVCRLQPKTERPSEREFDFSFEGECKAERGELVAAGLTLIRAYVVSGAKLDCKASRFPEWSRLCREPLIWAGEPDVLGTIEERRKIAVSEDTDEQFLRELIGAWWGQYEGRGVRLSDIDVKSRVGALLCERFRASDFGEEFNTKAAGKWLGNRKGHVRGDRYFNQRFDRNGVSQWLVLEANHEC